MLVETREERGMVVSKKFRYEPDPIVDKTAIKKENIIKLASLGTQLTLLGTLVEQIGVKIGLNTPEFTAAKALFASIKVELAKK